jgi:hypothetical protein
VVRIAESGSIEGNLYACLAYHTAGADFAVDLAAGRWSLLADLQAAQAAAQSAADSAEEAEQWATDPNVVAVAGNIASIAAVAAAESEVITVAGSVAAVNTVAAAVADIEVAAVNVADITNFADVYQGPKAAAPTTRNDGSALLDGDMYFDTALPALRVRSGAGWVTLALPALAVVATSGQYADLLGKPTLATVATSGAYVDLSGRPTLAAVATSGAYADLSGKPTLGSAAALNAGTAANNLVQLDGDGRLPALNASQLTNIPAASITRSTRTSNTILAAADKWAYIDATSGSWTQTITAAATLGAGWSAFYRNSGTGVITIDPNGAETIDGRTTINVYPGESFLIVCDGSAFQTVGRAKALVLQSATFSAVTSIALTRGFGDGEIVRHTLTVDADFGSSNAMTAAIANISDNSYRYSFLYPNPTNYQLQSSNGQPSWQVGSNNNGGFTGTLDFVGLNNTRRKTVTWSGGHPSGIYANLGNGITATTTVATGITIAQGAGMTGEYILTAYRSVAL